MSTLFFAPRPPVDNAVPELDPALLKPKPEMPTGKAEDIAPPPTALVTEGEIRGAGTEDDPQLAPIKLTAKGEVGNVTYGGKAQCECGQWFKFRKAGSPKMQQKRCYRCLRPDSQHSKKQKDTYVSDAVAEFKAMTRLLERLGDEAVLGKDPDVEKDQRFGQWGTIRCTERQKLAALCLAYGVKAAFVATHLRFPLVNLLAMFHEGMYQPRFKEMIAFYWQQGQTMVSITEEIPALEEDIRKMRRDGEPGDKIGMAQTRLQTTRDKVSAALPEPPKRAEVRFGNEGDEDIVALAKADMEAFVSTLSASDGRLGGRGEKR